MRKAVFGIRFVVFDASARELQRMATLYGRAEEEINEVGDLDISHLLFLNRVGQRGGGSHDVE